MGVRVSFYKDIQATVGATTVLVTRSIELEFPMIPRAGDYVDIDAEHGPYMVEEVTWRFRDPGAPCVDVYLFPDQPEGYNRRTPEMMKKILDSYVSDGWQIMGDFNPYDEF